MNKFLKAGSVKEVSGSAVTPEHARLAIIFTPCSISGEYESELYNKIVKRWARVRQDYRERFVARYNFKLGEIILTAVSPDIWVCQALMLNEKNKLDKMALESCVNKLVHTAKYENAHVHASQLSFKTFPILKKLLPQSVTSEGLNLYLYSEENATAIKS